MARAILFRSAAVCKVLVRPNWFSNSSEPWLKESRHANFGAIQAIFLQLSWSQHKLAHSCQGRGQRSNGAINRNKFSQKFLSGHFKFGYSLSNSGRVPSSNGTSRLCFQWHIQAVFPMAHPGCVSNGTSRLCFQCHIQAVFPMAHPGCVSNGTSRLCFQWHIQAVFPMAHPGCVSNGTSRLCFQCHIEAVFSMAHPGCVFNGTSRLCFQCHIKVVLMAHHMARRICS